jgi:hypothetical protein
MHTAAPPRISRASHLPQSSTCTAAPAAYPSRGLSPFVCPDAHSSFPAHACSPALRPPFPCYTAHPTHTHTLRIQSITAASHTRTARPAFLLSAHSTQHTHTHIRPAVLPPLPLLAALSYTPWTCSHLRCHRAPPFSSHFIDRRLSPAFVCLTHQQSSFSQPHTILLLARLPSSFLCMHSFPRPCVTYHHLNQQQ